MVVIVDMETTVEGLYVVTVVQEGQCIAIAVSKDQCAMTATQLTGDAALAASYQKDNFFNSLFYTQLY